MKKSFNTLLVAIFIASISFPSYGQGNVHITMEITDFESNDPQVAQMAEMMKGSLTEVYHMDGKTLTKLSLMGGMVAIDIHVNEVGDMDMLIDAMGQKIWSPATKAEQDRAQAESESPMSDLDITYDESDRKEIAGFDCYKMVAIAAGDESTRIEAYISPEIIINAAVMQGVDITQFKGFPLEFTMINPQATVTASAQSITSEVDAALFEFSTDGHQKMSIEELIQMSGGNLGF